MVLQHFVDSFLLLLLLLLLQLLQHHQLQLLVPHGAEEVEEEEVVALLLLLVAAVSCPVVDAAFAFEDLQTSSPAFAAVLPPCTVLLLFL